MLFDQLDDVLDACWQEQMVEVAVAAQWSQNFVLRPEEVRAACGSLLQYALADLRHVLVEAEPQGVARVLVTEAAGRLPGLCETLQDEAGERMPVIPLAADAAALGARCGRAFFSAANKPMSTSTR